MNAAVTAELFSELAAACTLAVIAFTSIKAVGDAVGRAVANVGADVGCAVSPGAVKG